MLGGVWMGEWMMGLAVHMWVVLVAGAICWVTSMHGIWCASPLGVGVIRPMSQPYFLLYTPLIYHYKKYNYIYICIYVRRRLGIQLQLLDEQLYIY